MDDQIDFHYNIDTSWHIIHRIREKVESLVLPMDENLAYGCKMASSELIENAVKYGYVYNNNRNGRYEFSLDESQATVSVSNGIVRMSDLENVKKHIDDIHGSENSYTLYLKRISLLMKNSTTERSRLGLFRIAGEGEFDLMYDYDNNKNELTVTAIKKR